VTTISFAVAGAGVALGLGDGEGDGLLETAATCAALKLTLPSKIRLTNKAFFKIILLVCN
jgi:hypothetical protein